MAHLGVFALSKLAPSSSAHDAKAGIEPSQFLRVNLEEIKCPFCNAIFVPETKERERERERERDQESEVRKKGHKQASQ